MRGIALVFLFLSAFALPSAAQRPSDVVRERLKTRPNDPTLYYFLALFEIADGRKAEGIAALEKVARIGKGFLPTKGDGFDPVWDDSSFQRVRAELEAKLPKVVVARELFRLDKGLIPEGIAYDGQTRSYYVGSVATGGIVRVDSAGAVTDFAPAAQRRPILGLAIDPARRLLHAVRTNGFLTLDPGAKRVNEVLSFELDSGRLARTLSVPGALQLNDIAVASNGDLYASDTQGGSVYRMHGQEVDTLALGALPGANGIALSPDGRVLYVAHSTTVGRVRLADGNVLPRLEIPEGESIAAIDGLYADGNSLIGIQNVTNPGRVIRLPLEGDRVLRVETLLSHHHPAIDEPTTGVLVGRTFALLATTQVTRYTPEGRIASPETVKPPVVLSIELQGDL